MIAISIIMPAYNAERYLSVTLDSVVHQKFKDFEIIAINDGSQDGSLEIMESYKSRIYNLKIINQPNSGVSSTRNKGIDLATGKYICFLDADDYLSPNYLSFLYEQAERYQCDIMCCNYYTFSGHKAIRNEVSCGYTRHVSFADLRVLGHATSPCTKLYKREFILKNDVRFNPESTYGEDYFFNWKLYILTDKTFFSDTPLYGYRQSLNGATSKYHPNLIETYLREYSDLRIFASTNSVLDTELSKEIDGDLIYRIPAILRMIIRSPFSVSEKIDQLKKLTNSPPMRTAASLYSEAHYSYITRFIIKNNYIRLFIYGIYAELKLKFHGYVKHKLSAIFSKR